jgi:predicted transcriptional regulator of viral defense system
MKYYSQLLSLRLFSKEQINKLSGNSDTAKTFLESALQDGYIERIRHNYYAIKSLETGRAIPNRYAIGSEINPSAYISHHTAFEYYGMANQVYGIVCVSSVAKFQDFSYDNVDYTFYPPNRILAL